MNVPVRGFELGPDGQLIYPEVPSYMSGVANDSPQALPPIFSSPSPVFPQVQSFMPPAPDQPVARGTIIGRLGDMAGSAAQEHLSARQSENAENARLGLSLMAPAFDDSGFEMPRAPGMAQSDGWLRLRNFMESTVRPLGGLFGIGAPK